MRVMSLHNEKAVKEALINVIAVVNKIDRWQQDHDSERAGLSTCHTKPLPSSSDIGSYPADCQAQLS